MPQAFCMVELNIWQCLTVVFRATLAYREEKSESNTPEAHLYLLDFWLF